jgi:hypothetical protein
LVLISLSLDQFNQSYRCIDKIKIFYEAIRKSNPY